MNKRELFLLSAFEKVAQASPHTTHKKSNALKMFGLTAAGLLGAGVLGYDAYKLYKDRKKRRKRKAR